MNTQRWEALLKRGCEEQAFPCYAAAVGKGNELYWRSLGGNRTTAPAPLPLTEDTLFDLASLSKLVGTTMVTLRLLERGVLRLHHRIGDFFASCHGKEAITLEQLLTHTSGITSHTALWKKEISPSHAADAVLSHPLAAPTGDRVIYSCMGFILLKSILETVTSLPLDTLVEREVTLPLGMKSTRYCPPPQRLCAATEWQADLNLHLCGTVHDENARFLGGVSGNAGLFSPPDDMIRFASMLSLEGKDYLSPVTFSNAIADRTLQDPDHARGLGFQLYRGGEVFPAGNGLSPGSYGHTGYTGTSLYVDRESGVYCLLLTNRVHNGRDTPAFFRYRKEFYNTVFADIRSVTRS